MELELNSKKDFDDSINLTKRAFFLSGFEIGERKHYFMQLFYCFNLMWLYTDVFGELSWLAEGMRMGKSIDELSLVAPCTMICLLSTAKTLPFFLNMQTFQKAINLLRSIHPDVSVESDEAKKIIIESRNFLKSTIFFFFTAKFVESCMFCFEPLMLMAYEYFTTGDIKLKLPFLIRYFFDAYDNTTVWGIAYVHQVWSTAVVSLNLFAADSLFYIFCTYLRMHFRLISYQFENVVTTSPEQTRDNMRKCVKRHQELIELVNLVERLYSKSTLFNVISSSILICLSGFNITVVQSTSAIMTFAPFLIMSLAQVFFICFFADLLTASSNQIPTAVYNCHWYEAEPAIKSCVLIVMIRSQKPCKLTASNFVDMNLTVFTTILSRSWSFLALLKTMYD